MYQLEGRDFQILKKEKHSSLVRNPILKERKPCDYIQTKANWKKPDVATLLLYRIDFKEMKTSL